MAGEDDLDDNESFYSAVPWEDAEPRDHMPSRHDPDRLEAFMYHAQLNSLPLTAAQSSNLWESTPKIADEQATPLGRFSSPPPPIPLLPERFRDADDQAGVPRRHHRAPASPHKHAKETRLPTNTLIATLQRPSTSGGEQTFTRGDDSADSETLLGGRKRGRTVAALSAQYTLSELQGKLNYRDMSRTEDLRDEDLFFELANDQAASEQQSRPASPGEPLESHRSLSHKRRSLPAESAAPRSTERRPQSSGHLFGRLGLLPRGRTSDLQIQLDGYADIPGRAVAQPEDTASISSRSRSGAPRRSATLAERSSLLSEEIKSSELPHFGRRRPSFGTSPRSIPRPRSKYLSSHLQDSYSQSPVGSSEPKRSIPDSGSVDSQTADTVWDELDDLKSRIKKLELTGKLPATSAAAVSAEQSERPRTATTAPTTIDSSPKHDKLDTQQKKIDLELESSSPEVPAEYIVGGADAANIHPNLHAALARAKPLLNPPLYRTLEATAADALQLAAMTGSAGPQGTALTAAAIINGVTVSDRHIRRKADTMCRNLTDLVLALCEGKIERPTAVSSPITINTPATHRSPSLRYSRSSLDPNDSLVRGRTRPMSRLEARRTSILGTASLGTSPLESGEDISASEHESTASRPRQQRDSTGPARATSRLQAARARRYENVGDDEDPTLRPLSRATTDIARVKSQRDYSTPQRSPGFREALAARRTSQEGQQDLRRAASLASDSGRSRRFLDPSTPSVVEEDGGLDDFQPGSQPTRRFASLGQHASRRSGADVLSRTTSLSQRREVLVE